MPTQGTRVPSLLQEDPPRVEATKLSPRVPTTEPAPSSRGAMTTETHAPQSGRFATCPSHRNEKPRITVPEEPCSPSLEEAHTQPRRLSTARDTGMHLSKNLTAEGESTDGTVLASVTLRARARHPLEGQTFLSTF